MRPELLQMTQITAPDAWLVTRQGLTQDLSYRGQRDVTYATSQQRAVRQSWAGLGQVQAGSSQPRRGKISYQRGKYRDGKLSTKWLHQCVLAASRDNFRPHYNTGHLKNLIKLSN